MSVEPPATAPGPSAAGEEATPPGPPRRPPVGGPLNRAARLGALVALVVLLGLTQGISMVIVVVAIVVMIFLHELGHYVMARRAGMLVTEFFIGFGPRIWSFHRGDTEYGIKAIPAGAYVKIVGMSNMEEVDPALEPRTYRQGRFHQRLAVAVAGSAMHFLIAIALLVAQFAFIGAPDGDRWQVGAVTPGSAAEEAGLRAGDRLVEFDGEPVGSFDDFRDLIAGEEPGRVELVIERDGARRTLPLQLSTRVKLIGTVREDIDVVDNGRRLVVGPAREGGAVQRSGLAGGATLVEVNGAPVEDLDDVVAAVGDSLGGRVSLTTSVDGELRRHEVDLGSAVGTTKPAPFLGVGADPVLVTEPLPSAAVDAVGTFGEVAWLSIQGIGRFLWPPNLLGFVVDAIGGGSDEVTDEPTPAEHSPSNVDAARPISIVGVAMLGSDISSERLANLVVFLAQLNIFIGVFNLMPLLPFDGGHVVIAVYEKLQELRRRSTKRYLADVSRMLPVAYGVVVVLVTVGLLAIFMDLTRGVSL